MDLLLFWNLVLVVVIAAALRLVPARYRRAAGIAIIAVYGVLFFFSGVRDQVGLAGLGLTMGPMLGIHWRGRDGTDSLRTWLLGSLVVVSGIALSSALSAIF